MKMFFRQLHIKMPDGLGELHITLLQIGILYDMNIILLYTYGQSLNCSMW
jgi:hypothetical protein